MPRVAADRILIVLMGAIGDVARGLSFATRLRRGYPDAHITWAIEPLSEPIVRHHPAIDQVLVFNRTGYLSAFTAFLREVRALRADLTIDLQRHLKSGVTSWASRAPVRLGFHRQNSREGNWLFNNHHVPAKPHDSSKLLQVLAFADWLEIPEAPVEFSLETSEADVREAEALLADVPRPFVTAAVGSSWASRVWFPDRTARVIEGLAEAGRYTVLIGGPGDVEFGAAVEKECKVPFLNLAGKTSLNGSVEIIRRAEVDWGPDSGPMHIAAAIGTPVVSFWGATSPNRSGPYANESGILEGDAPCRPCNSKKCAIDRECLTKIDPDDVVARVLASSRS